jgi:hypothetical protein
MRTHFYTVMLLGTAFFLMNFSPPAYSQAETHDFITYDTAIQIAPCPTCALDKWNVRISRPKNMFVAGNADTASRPAIFSMPGQGEHGVNNVAKLQVYGPHYWLSHGWDGGVALPNGKHYPILITSCYINNVYPTSIAYYNLLTYILKTYHIKKNSVHLAGLSQGAFTSGALILFEKTAGDETGMKLVTTLTCFEGTPDPLPSPYSTWNRNYTAYKVWAKKYGGRYFYLEGSGSDNFRDGWHYADAMNDTLAGSAYFSYEGLGGGAHCCWNSMYDPNATNWTSVGTLGPNNAPSQTGKNQMGDYKASSSVFQWMLQHGDTSLVGSNNPPPVPEPPPTVSAGGAQSITLPVNTATLTGTASETNGIIASYAWSQLGGPTTAGFGSAAKAQTTINNLDEGVYKFQLLVTDGLGNTATATVQVTVNAAAPVVPGPLSASAGTDQTITLPVNSIILTGSGAQTNGTIASYAWSQLSGPATAVLGTAGQAQTTVNSLVEGVYKFQILVTDAQGTTATATVLVTVKAAVVIPPPVGPPYMIKKVVAAEYRTWYITNDGKVYAYNNNSKLPVQFVIGGMKADTGAGGFNYFRIIDEQGFIWNSQIDWTTGTNRIDTDTTGAPFNGNKFVDAYGHVALTIRSDGSIWYFGIDNYSLFYAGGKVNGMTGAAMKPTQLSPAGMKFKKALFGYDGILALTTDGDVYKWTAGQGKTPTKIVIPRPACDIFISHLSVAGCIIPDAGGNPSMGWPYIWGATSSMWGATGNFPNPTPVRTLWKMTAPIKEMSVDWNTIHYIDSLGNMYGSGFNSFGEVGNGQEFVNKYDYPGFPNYGWTVQDYENPSGIPVQIGAGIKWKHMYANNWFGFYKYAQDENDSIYSWGRNKSLVLGNGLWGGYDNGAYHANILDVLKPTMVHPFTSIFNEYSFTPPTISVGPKQIISTPTATLKGVAKAPIVVSIKKPAPNGIDTAGYHIVSYQWTKISGTGGVITSPNAATTTVTGLSQGTYVFNLLTTDNNTGTLSANDTIVVTATVPGQLIVSAGNAQTITLPANSATLTGTASEVNGTIASYKWSQLNGPSTATYGSASQASTTVNTLVEGVYRFQLLVTDALGTTATATVQVTVKAAPVVPGPPSANAGSDQTITLPTSNVTLTGSGTETNGTIVTYAWTQLSGPSTAALGTAGQASTTATGLAEGVYEFQLKVTDNSGVTATDVTHVTVNPAVPVPGTPSANAGPDQTITLPANSVSLSGSGTETNGTIVSYAWAQLTGPATASFGTPGQAQSTATGLVEGTYRFEVTVTDALGKTAKATMQVTVKPAPVVPGLPSADAGGDQTITLPTNNVTLNGSGTETNGTIVSYKWEKTGGPSAGVISLPGQALTTVTGLVQGTYTFRLTVTDNSGVTATDVITVTVNPAPVVPNAPSADAGSDQTITLPVSNVTLTGSGSVTNGTIVSYAWVQTGGPSKVTIGSPDQAVATVTGMKEGIYSFRLTVTSDAGLTGTDLVAVTVKAAPAPNQAPIADAGPNQGIIAGTATADLDGSGSFDPDGSIVKYAWVQTSGAAGITIAGSNTVNPAVYGLQTGIYTFQLTVTDNNGATGSATMTITVTISASKPVAIVSKDTTVFFPNENSAVLDGAASYDPNGAITTYTWKQISGPGTADIINGNKAVGNVSELAIGDYVFELTVTNASGAAGTARMKVHVKDNERTSGELKLYPNPAPAGQQITIEGQNNYSGLVTFVLRDMNGRVVKQVQMEKHQPYYSQTIYLNGLGRGTYVLWVQFFLDQKPTALKLVID